jgi:chemotaxis protein MotB
MALLMCFFVLLLSFSSMDVEKYKRIAASMRNTFGVGAPGGVESFATGSVESPASIAPPAAQRPTAW